MQLKFVKITHNILVAYFTKTHILMAIFQVNLG